MTVAAKSGKFSTKEMDALEKEISAYCDIELFTDFPTVTKQQQLETDFYPKVWTLLKDHLSEKDKEYIPEAFIKLSKLELSISHGQVTVESFSETKMLAEPWP